MAQRRLLIASNNPGKVAEFRRLLDGCGWQILAPSDAGVDLEVDETGTTYAQNARLKAEAFAKASGIAALADDSGLEVDGLGGEPGALHHVNGWDGRDQPDRIAILLRAMRGLSEYQRSARFRAVIVLALPDGRVFETEGVCEGMITEQPAGDGGFGYDPVFCLPDQGVTMAQLTPAQKNAASHRGRAAERMRETLRKLASE